MTIVLAVPLLLLGMLIALRWSSRAPVIHPSCVRCGYDVSRAPSSRCAECGADLLTEGILTRAMGRTPVPARRATVNAGLLVIAMIGAAMFGHIWARIMFHGTEISHERYTVDQPLSGAYQAFTWSWTRRTNHPRMTIAFDRFCLHLEYDDGRRSRPLCIRPVRVDLRARGEGNESFHVLREQLAFEPVLREEDLPIDVLHEWAQRKGLDPDDPAIALELEEMRRIALKGVRLYSFSGQPLRGFAGAMSGFTTGGTHRLPVLLSSIAAALLAGLMTGWTWRAHNRTQRSGYRQAAEAHFADVPTTASPPPAYKQQA